jgi:hypothetical protein
MLYFGALCSPWYLVGSVLLICLVFYVVLWCFMFTVVFGEIRVVHRGIWWGPCCSSGSFSMLYFGSLCSPWYLVGSVLLICLETKQMSNTDPTKYHGVHKEPKYNIENEPDERFCLGFYVVLWCFMFTVVFGGVRVSHLFSFLCCALVLYVHRGIWWGSCYSSD